MDYYYYYLFFCAFITSQTNAIPVNVSVHYESLCPDSRAFILSQLTPTYKQLHSIVSLELVPFGNAHFSKVNKSDGQFDVEFQCQHGDQECIGNRIQSCVIVNERIDKSLDLVNCMFKSNAWKTPNVSAKECSTHLNIDWNSVKECSSGPLGRGLLLLNGEKHSALKPRSNSVPWVTINGKHTDDIQQRAEKKLLKLICDYYSGIKPKECNTQ